MKGKTIISRYILSLAAVGILLAPTAHAVTSTETDFRYDSDQDILFYAPYVNTCTMSPSTATQVAGEAQASAGLSALQAGFVDKYREIAVKLGIEYGIPWEAPLAQGILESAAGTSNFAKERNNFFGIGAFDANPNNAYRYATPEEGWRGYFENIRKTPTYRQHGAFNYPNDPYGYIAAIKAAGYATDPAYIQKVSSFIKAIQNRAQEQGWETSAVIAEKNPVIYENAKKNAAGSGTSAGASAGTGTTGGSSTAACGTTAGATSGQLQPGGVTEAAAAIPLLTEFIAYVKTKTGASMPSLPANPQFNTPLGPPGQNFNGQCDALSCGQCTALSMWFVNNKTNYTSLGRGNGVAVVANLAEDNRDKGLQTGSTPKPYAVFSWKAGGGGAGHTGVVIGVLSDESIITINNNYAAPYQVSIDKLSKAEYTGKITTFAYVGDKLK